MIRILIADDHSIVRRGLKQILLEGLSFAEVQEVSNGDDLLKKVMKEDWDIVVTDLSMPGKSGLEIVQFIKEHFPKIPVLVLSIYPEEQYAIRVLKLGAAGYLNKDTAPDELVKAVQKVLTGKKYITSLIAEKLATSLDPISDKPVHENLSDREFEVFKLLAIGYSLSEIANRLSLSITTISTYRSRIMLKMDLKSHTGLIQYAIENKLI